MTGCCPAPTGRKTSARSTTPSSIVIGTSQSICMAEALSPRSGRGGRSRSDRRRPERRAEAGLAAELAPHRPGLGKVAGGDVVPDLLPFVRRQYSPPRLVRAQEAVEPCRTILAVAARRLVEQEDPAGAGGTADGLHQPQFIVGREVMDRQAT